MSALGFYVPEKENPSYSAKCSAVSIISLDMSSERYNIQCLGWKNWND